MPKITTARKDQRRLQILAAAAACFARQGFHPTTIHDVCVEAGLSPGAVYGYFDSKDAIIEALAQAARRSGAEAFASAQGAAASADRLDRLLESLDRPGDAQSFQLDVRLWGEAIGNPQLRDLYLQSRAALTQSLIAIAEPSAAALGLEPEALAELLATVVAGLELQKAVQPGASLRRVLAALQALLAVKTEGAGA